VERLQRVWKVLIDVSTAINRAHRRAPLQCYRSNMNFGLLPASTRDSNMKRYLINVLASQDINEIADYFTANNIEAGERFFQNFARRCQQLVNFPKLGRNYTEIRPDLRGIPLDGYIIFYRILDDGI